MNLPNAFSNFFGTIGGGLGLLRGTDKSFIPVDSKGGVMQIKGAEACWLGLEGKNMQHWAYCLCAPLASVIDRLAEADVNGVIEILKSNGTEDYSKSLDAKRIMKLLKKPNPLQTWQELRSQQIVYKKTYGYCPVFAVGGIDDRSYTKYLWNLDPFWWGPVYEDYGVSTLFNGKKCIKAWKATIFGTTYEISSKDVFLLKDGYLESQQYPCLPMSKIAGLDWAVSNILAAMEADNVLLKKKGMLGFISHDPKPDPVSGIIPMDPTDKKELQENLSEYGLSWDKFQYVVSKLPIKWTSMAFNVRDLMTKETTRQGIDMICDRFGHPAELMSGKNATYENRSSAEKYMYNTNVIPAAIRDMEQYNNFFDYTDKFKIGLCFTDFPLLQEDAVRQGESEKAKAEANLVLFQNNVITLNMYRIRMGIDTVPGDDIYYSEWVDRQSKLYPVTFQPPSNKKAKSNGQVKKPEPASAN